MPGCGDRTGSPSSCVHLESHVRRDHPLRAIREVSNAALTALSEDVAAVHPSRLRRPSIPPERLLRAMLKGERATSARTSARTRRNGSTTDPEARLHKKGEGQPARLCYMGRALADNRHALAVDGGVTQASGRAEREAALDRRSPRRRIMLGADLAVPFVSGRVLPAPLRHGGIRRWCMSDLRESPGSDEGEVQIVEVLHEKSPVSSRKPGFGHAYGADVGGCGDPLHTILARPARGPSITRGGFRGPSILLLLSVPSSRLAGSVRHSPAARPPGPRTLLQEAEWLELGCSISNSAHR